MRVLMVSTSYPRGSGDWRGRFIYDMAKGLGAEQGVQLALWAPPGELPPGVAGAISPSDGDWLDQLSESGGIAQQLRHNFLRGAATGGRLLYRLRQACRRESPDVFHLNWLQNALAIWGLPQPALLTALGSDLALLRVPGMVALLRWVLAQRPSVIAPNGAWMVPLLSRYFGDVAEIRHIPFGVADPWYRIQRPQLRADAPWLVVTRITRAKLGHLLAWGEGAFGHGRRVILLGPMQEQITLPPWLEWRGPTHPQDLAENWFPQAAGLLTLSQHDEGLPQVMLEALAAGLPLVASNLAAHRELLAQRSFGAVVQSPAELMAALSQFEEPQYNREAGGAARAWMQTTIGDWRSCAGRYRQAYADLLSRAKGR